MSGMSCMAPHRHAQHFDVGVAGLGAVGIQQAAQVQPACRVRVAQRFNRRMEWHVAAVSVCPCAFGDDVFFFSSFEHKSPRISINITFQITSLFKNNITFTHIFYITFIIY